MHTIVPAIQGLASENILEPRRSWQNIVFSGAAFRSRPWTNQGLRKGRTEGQKPGERHTDGSPDCQQLLCSPGGGLIARRSLDTAT
jgi:hypothetical protein